MEVSVKKIELCFENCETAFLAKNTKLTVEDGNFAILIPAKKNVIYKNAFGEKTSLFDRIAKRDVTQIEIIFHSNFPPVTYLLEWGSDTYDNATHDKNQRVCFEKCGDELYFVLRGKVFEDSVS